MNVQKDVDLFLAIAKADMSGKNYKQNCIANIDFFNKPYLFSNENIASYLGKMDIKNKSVLTTGSSGDQVLYSQLYGAKMVTCFDINPFARYIYYLKAAYIKGYCFEEFKYLISDKNYKFNALFNIKHYKTIAANLPADVKEFWDSLFAAGLSPDTSMFTHTTNHDIFKVKYLSDKQTYIRLRNALRNNGCQIDFICCDIRVLPKMLDNFHPSTAYNIILLSNISDYYHMLNCCPKDAFGRVIESRFVSGKQIFKQIVNCLAENFLAPNGQIQVGYKFGGSFSDGPINTLAGIENLFNHKQLRAVGNSYDSDGGAIFYTPNPGSAARFCPPEPPQLI